MNSRSGGQRDGLARYAFTSVEPRREGVATPLRAWKPARRADAGSILYCVRRLLHRRTLPRYGIAGNEWLFLAVPMVTKRSGANGLRPLALRGERKPPGSDETVLRGIRRTFWSPGRRRTWGPMWQLQGLSRADLQDHCLRHKLIWSRHGHCDLRSELGTRGDSRGCLGSPPSTNGGSQVEPGGTSQREKYAVQEA
jgi:hypothetical protein